jgi:hypothetical protein
VTLPTTLQGLVTEVRGNRRLALGLLLALLLVWLYMILALRDATARLARELRQVNQEQARTESIGSADQWRARAQSAAQLRNQMHERIWRQPTLGLAQARFQEWLALEINRVGIGRRGIVPLAAAGAGTPANADDASESKDFWRVALRVDAEADPYALQQLLTNLARAKPQVLVEALNVRAGPPARFDMIVVAPFFKPRDSVKAE